MLDIPVATPEAVQLMQEGALAFARMEANGIRVNVPYLDKAIKETAEKIRKAEEELKQDEIWERWRKKYGAKANIDSPAQLGDLIFNELGYSCPGQTKKAERFKTDESAFVDVDLPFVRKYFQAKKLKKAKSTYLDGLKREVVGDRVHPSWNLHLSVSRSSCTSPNLTNIPNRDKNIAEIVRRCMIPSEGNVFAEIDFSAQEFKLACCFWADPAMVEYGSDPTKDIHRDEGAELFLCEKSEVSKEMRYLAKNRFVFPELYGSYYISCARNIWDAITRGKYQLTSGVSVKKHFKRKGIKELGQCSSRMTPRNGSFEKVVKEAEDNFNKRFPLFAEKKEKWWADYLERGWFRTMTGFILQGDFSRNFLMNVPIQSVGRDCLIWCLTHLQNWLDRHRMKSMIVAEIHDCMLLDCPPNELQDVLNAAKWIMTVGMRKHWNWFIVPIGVEVDVSDLGTSWADKAPYVEVNGVWGPK